MSEPRYTIKLEVTDNKKGEVVENRLDKVDGYAYLPILSDKVSLIGSADFLKLLGPLMLDMVKNKFGG